MNNIIMLISFYNEKALGIRYLERSLKQAGFDVHLVFFKSFNSVKPKKCSDVELDLLKELINRINPGAIGLSVMTSLYLETVYAVNAMLKNDCPSIPVIWGGVYPTLFPSDSLNHADFVIRAEGEEALIEFLSTLFYQTFYKDIKNLAYKNQGTIIINDIRPPFEDLDKLGYPEIGGNNKFFIDKDAMFNKDPVLNSRSFELSTSRGCPFFCSYCCSVNLRRLYKGNGNYVRFRSVSNVMDELNAAKSKMKNLKIIHFWDEIFSDEESWIDEFASRYKREINLPFQIWSHPLKCDKNLIQSLVNSGLSKVVMGIQSGSPRIRKEIFHRMEAQQDILEASRTLSECRVPHVTYDFMLQHPFETEDDIRQTYDLCMQLSRPFELQLHGLNFLPGTDIVDMAVKSNILSKAELERIMYSPIQEQYNTYWKNKSSVAMSDFWYDLIYMSQLGLTKPVANALASRHQSQNLARLVPKFYRITRPLVKLRSYSKKGTVALKAIKKQGLNHH